MYRRHGNKLSLIFLACDLAATTAVWLVAYFLRFRLWPSPSGVPDFRLVLQGLPTLLILAAVSYRLCGLYEIHRLRQLPRELGVLCKSSALLLLLAITVTFYRRDLYESRLALALFFALNALALAVVRRMLWGGLKYLRGRGLNYGRAVIVGSGRRGHQAATTVCHNRWTGLEAIGFVDRPRQAEPSLLPRLGTIDDLPSIVEEHDIDHVFIALPLSRYGELPAVYRLLSDLLVDVQLVPDLPDLAAVRMRTTEIDNVTFLSLRENPHSGWHHALKRSMDLAGAAAILVVAAPLIAVLSLLVKRTSSGPILFRQPRVGLGGKTFNMLKFRTMYQGAEQATGPVWAKAGDHRCTPLGRFMRRWSLDELPQLLNVLSGDMSLVGPRPERSFFIEDFRRYIPNYAQRHQVKAGMTGWAQVNGWRGNTSLGRRLECDLYYISNWSIWLDLRILVMTVWCGFRHRNAY